MSREKTSLVFRQDFFADRPARAAYAALMHRVFDLDVETRDALCGIDATCRPFAFFDAEGRCVASVEVFTMPLILDGVRCEAAAVRSVAVDENWRGRGLFRSLMLESLAWCDARIGGPVLLYTEDSALYERFGFHDVPQHKVVGTAPVVDAQASGRRLSVAEDTDVMLIERLFATRAPVSNHVAVAGGRTMFMTHVTASDDIVLDFMPALNALIVSKRTPDRTILLDVVASAIPPLTTMLGAMDQLPERIEILFPTDKLGWSGRPDRDDTGLMIRGPWPAAFDRPFMLPPTAEF